MEYIDKIVDIDIYLIDFGNSKKNELLPSKYFEGTKGYMGPEVISR